MFAKVWGLAIVGCLLLGAVFNNSPHPVAQQMSVLCLRLAGLLGVLAFFMAVWSIP